MGDLYLVKVEAGENNNKFYRMIDKGSEFTAEYGRIGAGNFQSISYPMSKWESTLKSKLKKGYVDQTRLVAVENTVADDSPYKDIPESSIRKIVERLQAMAKQTIKKNYTVAVQNVNIRMIDEAQMLIDSLNKIADETQFSAEKFNKELLELFKTIPRKMKQVSAYLIEEKSEIPEILDREQALLDVMRGQVLQNDRPESQVKKSDKTILEEMGLVIEATDKADEELIKKNLGEISDKYYQSWRVINIRTQERFDKFVSDNNIKEHKLLWHGSRNENWWSILCTSLVLRPNAVISGKMFGFGIYFAPKAKKSLGYTSLRGSYWAHGGEDSAFMSLYDVAYGVPYNAYAFESKFSSFDYEKLQREQAGANCLHAHAGRSLVNDEIIVYKEEQLTIKYLVELR